MNCPRVQSRLRAEAGFEPSSNAKAQDPEGKLFTMTQKVSEPQIPSEVVHYNPTVSPTSGTGVWVQTGVGACLDPGAELGLEPGSTP